MKTAIFSQLVYKQQGKNAVKPYQGTHSIYCVSEWYTPISPWTKMPGNHSYRYGIVYITGRFYFVFQDRDNRTGEIFRWFVDKQISMWDQETYSPDYYVRNFV